MRSKTRNPILETRDAEKAFRGEQGSDSLAVRLRTALHGRICLVALGNTEHGDDAAGVRLGEELKGCSDATVIVAGNTVERHLGEIESGGCDTVLFLDAVDVGAQPGAVVLLSSAQMKARFPQISTHRLSLGALAQLLESNGKTQVWLLGIQVQSLRPANGLSPAVQETASLLAALLKRVLPLDGELEQAFCECLTT